MSQEDPVNPAIVDGIATVLAAYDADDTDDWSDDGDDFAPATQEAVTTPSAIATAMSCMMDGFPNFWLLWLCIVVVIVTVAVDISTMKSMTVGFIVSGAVGIITLLYLFSHIIAWIMLRLAIKLSQQKNTLYYVLLFKGVFSMVTAVDIFFSLHAFMQTGEVTELANAISYAVAFYTLNFEKVLIVDAIAINTLIPFGGWLLVLASGQGSVGTVTALFRRASLCIGIWTVRSFSLETFKNAVLSHFTTTDKCAIALASIQHARNAVEHYYNSGSTTVGFCDMLTALTDLRFTPHQMKMCADYVRYVTRANEMLAHTHKLLLQKSTRHWIIFQTVLLMLIYNSYKLWCAYYLTDTPTPFHIRSLPMSFVTLAFVTVIVVPTAFSILITVQKRKTFINKDLEIKIKKVCRKAVPSKMMMRIGNIAKFASDVVTTISTLLEQNPVLLEYIPAYIESRFPGMGYGDRVRTALQFTRGLKTGYAVASAAINGAMNLASSIVSTTGSLLTRPVSN